MQDRPARRGWIAAATLLVAAGTLFVMIATEPQLAMVWDEGYTLGREARVRLWLRAFRDPQSFAKTWKPPKPLDELVDDRRTPPRSDQLDTRSKLLSHEVVTWFWPFGREEPHGHPPFYAIVGVLGDVVVPHWAELPRSRFGPMLVFSLTAGAIFGTFLKRAGAWPAALAAGAWILQPHLFALGHYAGYDAILSSLWVGAILAFSRALERSGTDDEVGVKSMRFLVPTLVFGVLCGFAACTKLTGWFLPLPFLTWAILCRNRKALVALGIGGVAAVVTLYLFNPPWWFDPIGGPIRFFQSNLSRAKTIPIRVMFLGTVYRTPIESLPWSNTIVWTAIVTPVGFLIFALLGFYRGVRERIAFDPLPISAVGHWVFLLILRALPHTPGHDGVRQFLPAFGCLALVAGVGASWAVKKSRLWGRIGIVLALGEGVVGLALMMPVPLSYFSLMIGGLPGAARLGMEPTYYWDSLSAATLDDLARKTPHDSSVRFMTFPTSWLYLQRTGAMRFSLFPVDRGKPPLWYVVQNRPGEFDADHRRLIRDLGPKHVAVAKSSVPLIWVFPQHEAAKIVPALKLSRGLSP